MSSQTLKRGSHATKVDALKPLLRAYALGLATSTVPKVLRILREIRRSDAGLRGRLGTISAILLSSFQLNRFPAACAIIVGGTTLLPKVVLEGLRLLLKGLRVRSDVVYHSRVIRYLCLACSFLSAGLAFQFLNEDCEWVQRRPGSLKVDKENTSTFYSPHQHHTRPRAQYAGKTIDLTLFAFVRAVDLVCITAWTSSRLHKWHPEHLYPRLSNILGKLVDPSIFATSSVIIMWSWFYFPGRLPHDYNRWISGAAEIDPRLIQALRLVRQGDFVYGQETGQADLLKPLCQEYNLPDEYADPCKRFPIPCELYHSGYGVVCEIHAMARFYRSFLFALKMYLPLQILARVRNLNLQTLMEALKASSQSSSFLAAFVSLFYYGVCLARTRVGPKLFSNQTITPQMWDSGLCVLAGCLLSGWSILLEKPSKRQEIAFFVAPRALATLLPRVYDKTYRAKEQLVFATSIAVIMSTVASADEKRVRGVLGRILARVMKQ